MHTVLALNQLIAIDKSSGTKTGQFFSLLNGKVSANTVVIILNRNLQTPTMQIVGINVCNYHFHDLVTVSSLFKQLQMSVH